MPDPGYCRTLTRFTAVRSSASHIFLVFAAYPPHEDASLDRGTHGTHGTHGSENPEPGTQLPASGRNPEPRRARNPVWGRERVAAGPLPGVSHGARINMVSGRVPQKLCGFGRSPRPRALWPASGARYELGGRGAAERPSSSFYGVVARRHSRSQRLLVVAGRTWQSCAKKQAQKGALRFPPALL